MQITDYLLKPVDYEEFGTCVDSLRISLFERAVSGAEEKEQSKTILQLTRYLQEHLAEELSLQILAEGGISGLPCVYQGLQKG